MSVQAPYVRATAPFLATLLIVLAIIIEVLAAFGVSFGGLQLVPLGLAVFMVAFI